MARGSPKMKANIKTLMDERDRLLGQMEALKHKIGGLELAISLIDRDDNNQLAPDTSKRGNAKTLLIDLLKEAGTTGLNAATAVEIAGRRGIKLERGTAASNLSRMKSDGTVLYDGTTYRLPEFTRPRGIAPGPGMVVSLIGGVSGSQKSS